MSLIGRGAAEVIGLVLSLVSTVWVTRAVGPALFGYYAVALTIITLGTIGINAGLSTAGAQRAANEPERAGEIRWAVLISRALIAVPAVTLGIVLATIAPIASVFRDLLVVGFLVWVVLPFRMEWLLIAEGRLAEISTIRVLGSLASVLVALLFVRDPSDASRLPFIAVTSAAVSAAGTMLVADRSWPLRRPIGRSVSAVVRDYLGDGVHYLKSDVSVFIFTSSDRLFLYVFTTPAVVGLYEAAYRVIQPFYTISTVVGDTMYLQLAKTFGTARLKTTLRRYVDLMCLATIPLGFFLFAFAPAVISLLYGAKYSGASQYLGILGWVITFGYMSGIAVLPFTAWNLPREYGNSTSLGGLLNLGLNLALIPSFGGLGAAWATVAAKVAVTVAGLRYFRRATDYPLVRDFGLYSAISAVALAAAFLADRFVGFSAASGMVVFGVVYVGVVVIVHWRRAAGF